MINFENDVTFDFGVDFPKSTAPNKINNEISGEFLEVNNVNL